jgi:hypothetical protein
VDDSLVAKFVDMGFDANKAKKALQKTTNDFDAALDILNKEDNIGVEAIANSLSILDDTSNVLIKMMVYICKKIEEANERCFICHQTLEQPSIKFRPCTSSACEFTFEESFKGRLLTELKYFTHEAQFDFSIAAKAILSARAT